MSTYGLWLSTAGLRVNEHRQALQANNMANVNTTGFKHDLAVVTQRPVESRESPEGSGYAHPVLDGLSGGLNVRPTYHNFRQGPIEWTGRPLDVAIEGDGFFAVREGNATRYTRDGEFTLNATGELVLAAGDGRVKVLAADGSPIRVDSEGGRVDVSTDGTIRQGENVVAQLALVTAEDKAVFQKVGRNLFDADANRVQPSEAMLRPESRERSNLDIVQGLASMIETSRAYEFNARMIQLQDQMTDRTVNTVGRMA